MINAELKLMDVTKAKNMSICSDNTGDHLLHIFADNRIDLALTPIYCEEIIKVFQRAKDLNGRLYPDMETAAFFICSNIYNQSLNPQLIAVRISVGAVNMDKSNFKMIITLDDSNEFMVATTIITREALIALEENLRKYTSVDFLPSYVQNRTLVKQALDNTKSSVHIINPSSYEVPKEHDVVGCDIIEGS